MRPGSHLRLKPRLDLPFSRPIDVDDVPNTGLDLDIEATEAERAAMAAEADLPAIATLAAHLRIDRLGGPRVEVTGDLKATITQTCVVTLEPFDSEVEQSIEVMFAPAPKPPAPERPQQRRRAMPAQPPIVPPPQAADVDAPDPIIDGVIDLGAVVFEFLVLARDLYPRKPGVEFSGSVVGEPERPDPSAFAALQRLKDSS